MDKLKYKIEVENLIIAEIIANMKLLPFFMQKIDIQDFSEINQNVIQKLNTFIGQPVGEYEILTSLGMVKGFSIPMFLELKYQVVGTEKRLLNNIQVFYDILTSIKLDGICQEILKQNSENIRGLDALDELTANLKPLDGFFSKFKVEKKFSDRIDEILNGIEKDLHSNSKSFVFNSMPSFNNLFRPTNLVGIAGAYKAGKTSLGLEMICDLAVQGIPVGIMELEMSQEELDLKILAKQTGISYFNLRNPKNLTDRDKIKISHYKALNKNLPIYIDDAVYKMSQVENKYRHWVENYGVRSVLIDYWGLIQPSISKAKDNRESEMSRHSALFKILTKELKVVTFLLAQLNRSGVNTPGSENLGESIALARDSDFFYVVSHPVDMKTNSVPLSHIQIDGQNFPVDESHFVVKLDRSRHSVNNKTFLLKLAEDGCFKEIFTNYNDYQEPIKSIFNESF